MPYQIYLAGPDVFEADVAARAAELKAICEKHGVVGRFPLDNALPDVSNPASKAEIIRYANEALIGRCDAVLANMIPFRGPSMDPGTAYEMGFGRALGKVVVGYTSQNRPPHTYLERVISFCESRGGKMGKRPDGQLVDPHGMAVEDFGLADNLMMAAPANLVQPTFEEALILAINLLNVQRLTIGNAAAYAS